MVKKSAHPEFRLFEYLNGTLDKKAAQAIEAHLSGCDDCASVARLVRALKEAADELNSGEPHLNVAPYTSRDHPDLSELASFFYTRSRRAPAPNVAAHVALCGSCVEAIAQYARAERAAGEYNPASVTAGAVPAEAWALIREWEDSSFAKVRPAHEVFGQELMARLLDLADLRAKTVGKLSRDVSESPRAKRIAVTVVSRSGEARSTELFEEALDVTGTTILRHTEGSVRFANKTVYALLEGDQGEPVVKSEVILRDRIMLQPGEDRPPRADFFIIED
jgi:anti-sigma factor ChrR (cupin superfamily)